MIGCGDALIQSGSAAAVEQQCVRFNRRVRRLIKYRSIELRITARELAEERTQRRGLGDVEVDFRRADEFARHSEELERHRRIFVTLEVGGAGLDRPVPACR